MNTNYFDSPITQYDQSFDALFTDNMAKKGFACSYFAILTAWKFLKGFPATLESHIDNVKLSVKVTKELSVTGGIQFSDLVDDFTSLKSNAIVPASTELIATKVIQYSDIFPNLTETTKK